MKLIGMLVAGWILSVWLPVPQFIRSAISGTATTVAQGVK